MQENLLRRLCRLGLATGHVAVLLAFLGLVVSAVCQSSQPTAPVRIPNGASGSIQGIVFDREGAVCEGAHIELKRRTAGPADLRTAISDSDGHYSFSGLPAGPFEIIVSSPGFTTRVVDGVLHAGENYLAPPVTLLVTAAESDVQVTAFGQDIAEQDSAAQQVKEEEQQRVLGVIPNFYVSYEPGAVPLTPRQKFHLAWRSSIDPVTFLATGAFAGIEQANNSFSGYGQGAEGYAKRYGAIYTDGFTATMIGGALLPSLLKQDPRYFYKGTGSRRSRVWYAIKMSVICRGDNGRWQANYSAIAGGFASAALSNLYYPAANRNGVALTFENFGLGTAESAAGNLFQEFVVRKLTPRLPHFRSSQP